MKRDYNRHHFTQAQTRATQTFPTSGSQERLLLPVLFKGLREIIQFTENLVRSRRDTISVIAKMFN